ncbi:MAG: phosphodiester glycosidase family protein, partial [Candidatus Eremiobacteraeota bacterium]|nr:phosphodiester glycosidase family protein [Candidatus Eremiobacteraeota bacterium]
MSRRNGRLYAIIAAFALVAVAGGFAARGAIERAAFVHRFGGALGTDVDVSSADYRGNRWVVRDLVVGTSASPARLQAPFATIESDEGTTRVALDRPVIGVASSADAADTAARLGDALAAFERAYPKAEIRFHAGRIALAADVAFDAIEGTFRFARAGAGGAVPPSYDGTLQLTYGGSTYPVAVRSAGETGALESLQAAALPAAAFAALERADADVKPLSGTVRDVDWEGSRGSARLDDVAFSLGAHRLHGLHGDLILARGGIGSKKIAGFLDAVPFDAAGEVHDVPASYRSMFDGSRDLRAYAGLIRSIAAEPQLRSVHVDTTAPGLGFAQYAMQTAHGPLAINVLTIDPAEPTLRFDTAIAEDHVVSSGERTSAMGVRTSAVAGVNGDYFDIGRTYQPQGMLVRSGEIVRGPVDRAALVIDDSKRVRFDEFRIVGTVRAAGRTFPITQLNDWPAGAVTVITPAFGKTIPAADGVTFAALQPAGRANRYRVTRVTPATAPQPVAFGIAFGPKVTGTLHAGEVVDVAYRLEPDVAHAVAAIGGGPILVRDGAWYEDPHAPAPDERDYRWPVVALARAGDRLLLVAADGRHPERSVGMTRPEFGALLIRLGATDAMALDSGGSVTMVSRAPGDATVSVRNVPSDHSAERWISDALFIYSSAGAQTIVAPAATV